MAGREYRTGRGTLGRTWNRHLRAVDDSGELAWRLAQLTDPSTAFALGSEAAIPTFLRSDDGVACHLSSNEGTLSPLFGKGLSSIQGTGKREGSSPLLLGTGPGGHRVGGKSV